MYQHLLVATDGSTHSDKAVTHAIALATKLGARVTVFYAAPDYPEPMYTEGVLYERIPPADYAAAVAKDANRILAKVAKRASAAGVSCDTQHTMSAAPWDAIIKAARKAKCDVIVMGSHGRGGLAALLLGSETQRVLAHSKLPVIVVR